MLGMQNVVSSYISAIGYDAANRELHVRLAKVDETHIYQDVDQAVYDRLMLSDSKGGFVNSVLRRNYRHRVA